MSRRRRITVLDVLGEVRRSLRILRRVERYLVQGERDAKRAATKAADRAELRELARARQARGGAP